MSPDLVSAGADVPARGSADAALPEAAGTAEASAGPLQVDAGLGTSDAAAEPEADVESPPPGGEPLELVLEGFGPAVVVPPSSAAPSPPPLVVVLHGNFDRPEWQCGTWAPVGAGYGWLLCPRGSPRTDVAPELDRWTWDGPEAAAREVTAAVRALHAAWPALVLADRAILVGFSLGARYAPLVAAAADGPVFRSLVLVEQGFAVSTDDVRAACDAGVEQVLYLCGERTECKARAERAAGRWRRAGAEVDVLVMDDVGHAYPEEFDPLAERVLARLVPSEDPAGP